LKYSRKPSGRIVSFVPARGTPVYISRRWSGESDIYSVRIGLYYRALAVMKGSVVVWYWIGGHSSQPYHDAFLEPIAVPVVANW
jgi:hypothetical protein